MGIEDLLKKYDVGFHKLNGGYSLAIFYGGYGELWLSLKEITNELFEGTLSFKTLDGRYYELLAIGKFTLQEIEKLFSNREDISNQLRAFCDRARNPFCDEIEQNSRVYNSLSYAAKYEPDVKFSVRQLEELIEINEKILRWYRKHGLANEEYRHE